MAIVVDGDVLEGVQSGVIGFGQEAPRAGGPELSRLWLHAGSPEFALAASLAWGVNGLGIDLQALLDGIGNDGVEIGGAIALFLADAENVENFNTMTAAEFLEAAGLGGGATPTPPPDLPA